MHRNNEEAQLMISGSFEVILFKIFSLDIQMQFLFFKATEVSPLGRANLSNMSDQTRMELLVANIQNIDALKDKDGDFLEIKE